MKAKFRSHEKLQCIIIRCEGRKLCLADQLCVPGNATKGPKDAPVDRIKDEGGPHRTNFVKKLAFFGFLCVDIGAED